MPLWAFKRAASPELVTMLRRLADTNPDLRTETLREIVPEALTARAWLQRRRSASCAPRSGAPSKLPGSSRQALIAAAEAVLTTRRQPAARHPPTRGAEPVPMRHATTTTSPVTRRQAVGMAGAAGAAMLLSRVSGPDRPLAWLGVSDVAQAATTSCVLTPSKTEGPYFVDEKLNRSDIRTDPSDGSIQPGAPVALTMVVVRADGSCAPVQGAVVDIWHANAAGRYSDVSSEGTAGKKYLRGLQVSGADGAVWFQTIYPGWYQGRAVHIHFKVRVFDGSSQTYEFTSQLFFDPATTSAVYGSGAYAARGQASTSNASDGIYGADGAKLIVALQPDGSGGYAGTFVVGLSGLPAGVGTSTGTAASTGTSAATGVGAALASARFRRTKTGRRILRVSSRLTETADVRARLSRSGTTIVRRSVSDLAGGTRAIDLRVPLRTPGGKARLSVVYTDSAGSTKAVTRGVTIPRKSLRT